MLQFTMTNEKLNKLTSNIFITDNPTDIVNLCKNKPKPYRIVYDRLIDKYMICDANSMIHMNMVGEALKQGYYDNKDILSFLSALGVASNTTILHRSEQIYWSCGYDSYPLDEDILAEVKSYLDKFKLDYDSDEIYPWIYAAIFQPTDIDFMSLGEDSYDHEENYSYGTMFTRDFAISELSEFQRALNRANESVKESYNGKKIPYDVVGMAVILRDYADIEFDDAEMESLVGIADSMYNVDIRTTDLMLRLKPDDLDVFRTYGNDYFTKVVNYISRKKSTVNRNNLDSVVDTFSARCDELGL